MPLPSKPEIEVAAINLMLGSNEACIRLVTEITEDMFTTVSHRTIVKVVSNIIEQGNTVDYTSISTELSRLQTGVDLTNFSPDVIYTEGKVSNIIRIIKETYLLRTRIQICDKISKTGSSTSDIQKFLKESSQLFWTSTATSNRGLGIVSSGNLANIRREIMLERMRTVPILTGWEELDNYLSGGGFSKGTISIIAGRPSHGKSLTKANLIYNLCERGIGVCNVAVEQTLGTEMDRIDTLLTGILIKDLKNVRNWNVGDSRINLVKEAQIRMDEHWNYHIIHKRSLTLNDVYLRLQQIQTQKPIQVVFFDLFDKLIDVNVDKNKPQTVGKKLGEAAIIAENLGIHLCLLVQINREVERRKDKRPTLSDLKDSGSYEEVARLVMLLYRDSYYNPDNLNDIMELIIAKQNDGPSNIRLEFSINPEIGRVDLLSSTAHFY